MRNYAFVLIATLSILSGCGSMKENPYAQPSGAVQAYPAVAPVAASPAQQKADALEGQARALFAQGLDTQGLTVLKQAADLGSGSANYELAKLYIRGAVVRQDNEQAHAYLLKSDAAGYAEGTRVLAWQTLRGSGTPQNVSLGQQLIEKAARSSVRAQREAGLLYLGFYQPNLNNPGRGARLLQMAYQAGDAESAYYYSKAIRVSSSSEAKNALLFAGKAGFPKALMDVGNYSLKSGETEFASACYLKAAFAGDADAMYTYADNVLNGRIRTQNPELVAYLWLSVANDDYNHPQARRRLQSLDNVRQTYDYRKPGYLDKLKNETRRMITPWGREA